MKEAEKREIAMEICEIFKKHNLSISETEEISNFTSDLVKKVRPFNLVKKNKEE